VVADARDVTLTLAPGEPLAGRVVTRAGAPVPVFSMFVYRRSGVARDLVTSRAIVNADGRFAVYLEPGRYDVVARARGWTPSAATAASPGTPVELVVDEGASLTGTVVAAATGAPIAGAHVALEGHSAVDDFGVVTGADGTFELRGVPAGPVSIAALAEGYETRIEAGLVARDGRFAPVTMALGTPNPGEERLADYVGIGVTTRPDGDDIVVEEVLPSGGAYAAGIVAGDRIVTVDGQPVTELGEEMAVTRIHGQRNTTVSLGVRRDGVVRTVVVQRRPMRA
jgi:membrane-associated protease RseP (regulator of RpoE activity)